MFPLSDSIKSNKFPFLNVAIIVATAFVFLQQIGGPEAFTLSYALVPANVNFSDFNTLVPFVTSVFLHGGFLHIISNMWFLWVFGDDVEGHFGHATFVFLYLSSGVVGGLSQYVLMSSSPIPMLGASGAVAGVLGAYFITFPHSKIKTLVPIFGLISIINVSAPFMLGYWFILQLISGAVSLPFSGESGGVAFFAHVGGFLTGVLFAKILRKEGLAQAR